jgi:hypothetical protein
MPSMMLPVVLRVVNGKEKKIHMCGDAFEVIIETYTFR